MTTNEELKARVEELEHQLKTGVLEAADHGWVCYNRAKTESQLIIDQLTQQSIEQAALVERYRAGLEYYRDAHKTDIAVDTKGVIATEILSQPLPTGFGAKALELVRVAIRRDKASGPALSESMKAEDADSAILDRFYKADEDLDYAVAAFTEDEIRLIGG